MTTNHQGFTLENFEGTLELLLYLIRKNELDVGDVPIREITSQYLERLQDEVEMFDEGGDFLLNAASLLLLKSQTLLPDAQKNDHPDPGLEMLQHVIDYCQLKQKGKDLAEKEMSPIPHYPRGRIEKIPQKELGSGIDHLSLKELAYYLDRALARSKEETRTIDGEEWKVDDAILMLRQMDEIFLDQLFTPDKPRGQLIVLFLAILEMMKQQELEFGGNVCRKK